MGLRSSFLMVQLLFLFFVFERFQPFWFNGLQSSHVLECTAQFAEGFRIWSIALVSANTIW